LQIAPASHADAPVIFAPSVALSPINSDPRQVNGSWILNTDDLSFDVHVVSFTGKVVVPQHGPLTSQGNSIYKYLGCYLDAASGGPRLFSSSTENGDSNENGLCQQQAYAAGAVFAGTEFHTECWYGSNVPNISFYTPESEDRCSWTCPADDTQSCGGIGGYMSLFYDSTKYDPVTGVCTGCSTTPAPPAIVQSVGPYSYIGCYTEGTAGRALSGAAYAYDSMTVQSCAADCTGFSYFGVEYGRECYCGDTLNAGSVVAPGGNSECSMVCGGNSTTFCGAGSRLSMYALNTTSVSSSSSVASISSTLGATPSISGTSVATATPTGPSIKQTVGSYSYYGCQTESTTGRALDGASLASDSMTLELCKATCAGYTYWGTEYGRECYCGDFFGAGSIAAPATDCSFLCPGDSTEYCGAGNRLSVYVFNSTVSSSSSSIPSSTVSPTNIAFTSSTSSTPTPTGPTNKDTVGPYRYYGCQTEASNMRALSGAVFVNSGMTLEFCEASCAGWTYWGTEYGQECYCGDSFNAGSVAAPATDCSFLCPGDSTEYCGAGNRLSVYVFNSTVSSSSSSLVLFSTTPSSTLTISSTSSVLSASSTPLPTGPANKATVGPYRYYGCQTEASNMRALSGASFVVSSMTLEFCEASCAGWTYWGTEYGQECYCGDSFNTGSVPAPDTDCSFLCPGDSTEYCGAGNRLSVYVFNSTVSSSSSSLVLFSTTPSSTLTISSTSVLSASSTPTPTGPANKATVGPYRYYGCQTEASSMRALSGAAFANSGMTLEFCEASCAGWTYWGTEYGQECYCGDSFNAGSVPAPDTDCSFLCPGDNTEL
jgi:WSC domain